jgi:hypothetical protein
MRSVPARTSHASAPGDRGRHDRLRTHRARLRLAACLTILAIGGTLPGCGIYGRPRRPAPEPEAATKAGAPAAVASMPLPKALAARS